MSLMSCVCYVMLSRLILPEEKGLTSWFLFAMFIVILLLPHLVSLDRCGTYFLIT